ncbi:MAG: hypothetical protein JXB38_18915 [Anaerolineales bacterium]|nr:hypothetical protein [Anaerolineales bacterium]
MAKSSPKQRRLIYIAAAIWIPILLVLIGAVGLFVFGDGMALVSGVQPALAKNDAGVAELLSVSTQVSSATPTDLPTQTPQPSATATVGMAETVDLIPSATMIPTETPLPSPTPTATPVEFYDGPIVIGHSVKGNPLEVHRFGTGPRAVMVVAGIHGGYEANTVWLAEQLIAYVQYDPGVVPEDVTLYILPVLNPDGLEHMHRAEGRMNANGVDLNRNWTVSWEADWPRSGCWDMLPINSGPYPASEPETLALMGFVINHPLVALVSYHASAPGFYPADDPFQPKSDWLAEDLAAASGYPNPAINMGCYMTGSLVDWVASTGAAAVDLELTDHYNTDYDQNLRVLEALLNWDR